MELCSPTVLAAHATTLAVYAWRLLGGGVGVRSPVAAVSSLAVLTALSVGVGRLASGTGRCVALVAGPVVALLHLHYNIRPAYVSAIGKAVFITGCDSGFGHRLALLLDALGFHVIAACQYKGQGRNDLVASASSRLDTVELDVTDEDSVAAARKFVEENLEQGEELWCVVNNAGIYAYYGELELVPMEYIEKTMAINYMGTVRVTKTFLPLLRRSKGRLVNVTSATGTVALPNLAAYSSSKYAVEALSLALRDEMHKWGVGVSVVRPGPYTMSEQKKKQEEQKCGYLDTLWSRLPADVQLDYGKQYIDAYSNTPPFASTAEPVAVLTALQDAVMSRRPLQAYRAGHMTTVLPLCDTVPGSLANIQCTLVLPLLDCYLPMCDTVYSDHQRKWLCTSHISLVKIILCCILSL